MGYPVPVRSLNGELFEGATDGAYKKIVQGRGGVVEPTTHFARMFLSDTWYGVHESVLKTLPDGRQVHTPLGVETAIARLG